MATSLPANVPDITAPLDFFAPDILRAIDEVLNQRSPEPLQGLAPGGTATAAEQHFRVARRLLKYLLGDDIAFPGGPAESGNGQPEARISSLYGSSTTRAFFAQVLKMPERQVSPLIISRLFSLIAWINRDHLESTTAQAQLECYVYAQTPFWSPSIVLGQGEYSQLGALFDGVPQDLQGWMVQFLRGKRYVPVALWLQWVPPQALYQGVVAAQQSVEQPWQVLGDLVSQILPNVDSHEDQSLANALVERLGSTDVDALIIGCLQAIAAAGVAQVPLAADLAMPMAPDTRGTFFQLVATQALDSEATGWLDAAIGQARQAPGMQALSLAISLHARHASLTPQRALGMAALLLRPLATAHVPKLEPLPDIASLAKRVPGLATWSSIDSAEALFQALGLALLCTPTPGTARQVLRLRAHDTWIALMQTASFRLFCQPLLRSMGWYGSGPAEQPSPRISQALLGRALVERFCTEGESVRFLEQLLAGTDITQYNHAALLVQISEKLAQRNTGASAPTLEMLRYLLLREMAPELLVKDVADHFCYGRSLLSVALMQNAGFLETTAPGILPRLSQDDVLATGLFLAQTHDPAAQGAWSKARVIPALRYAAAHGAITLSQGIDQASATQVGQALDYLKEQQDLHAQEMNCLLTIKPPDRKQLAHQMLSQVGVPPWLWNQGIDVERWPVLQQHGLSVAASYQWDRRVTVGLGLSRDATVEELVMMGEVYKAGAPTIEEQYEQAFTSFKESLIAANGVVIKRLMAQMSDADQALLAGATSEVSRVRFGEEVGRHGVLIRCQTGDRRSDFHDHAVLSEILFEVIPAAGVARRTTNRFEYRVQESQSTGVISVVQAWQHHEHNQQAEARAEVTPLLDLDSDAYLKGVVSRSSQHLQHPLQGTLQPSAELVFAADGNVQDLLESLSNAAAAQMLGQYIDDMKVVTQHQTGWERTWEHERQIAHWVARLLVPFYGCIADLRKGDHSAGVIFECSMDALFTLVPMGQFLRSTATVVLRATELSVLSITRLMGNALARLTIDVAMQTTVLGLVDVLKLGVRLARSMWEGLFVVVPALRQAAAWPELFLDGTILSRGIYRVTDALALSDNAVRAVVDGQSDALVRNMGSAEVRDYRALDPYTGKVFGKSLNLISEAAGVELASAERITPGHYPPLIVARRVEGGGYEVGIAQGCRVRVLEHRNGVFDVVVDDAVYRLSHDGALRRLDIAPLSSRKPRLKEIESLCRPKRGLEEAPCASGVKLISAAPVVDASASTHLGANISWAFEGREFRLAHFSVQGEDAVEQTMDVLVNEGKPCKWAEGPGTSSQASGKKLIPLNEHERLAFSLPDTVVYREAFQGRLSTQVRLGFRPEFLVADMATVNRKAPVIELDSIAEGIDDARTLRGIGLHFEGQSLIVVEPDNGVFYRAATPLQAGDTRVSFTRLKIANASERELINDYLALRDQYRFVRTRPSAVTDRDNIARLLFDMLSPAEKAAISAIEQHQLTTYERFAQWCITQNTDNDLLRFAERILTGEIAQANLVKLAKDFIVDFKPIAQRTIGEQQQIIDVLNNLLPVQKSKKPWEALNLENIGTAAAHDVIAVQLGGSNLAFISAVTESGDKSVYYALAGGKRARRLKLKPEVEFPEPPETLIGDVPYRDARARMRDKEPDPAFVSLPVTRSAEKLTITDFDRHLDAERLLATVFKEDMAGQLVARIDVFTFLDTCPSCGGFVLPRLKLDFPGADFSVTYLREYTGRKG